MQSSEAGIATRIDVRCRIGLLAAVPCKGGSHINAVEVDGGRPPRGSFNLSSIVYDATGLTCLTQADYTTGSGMQTVPTSKSHSSSSSQGTLSSSSQGASLQTLFQTPDSISTATSMGLQTHVLHEAGS